MAGFYSKGIETAIKAVTGSAAAPTGTLKLAFMDTGYTQNQETDQYWSDISASIATNTTAQTVSGLSINVDTTNDRIEIDFTDITVSTVTTDTDQVVLYMDTGVASTSPLIVCAALATTLSPVSGDLTLTVNSEGLAAVTY